MAHDTRLNLFPTTVDRVRTSGTPKVEYYKGYVIQKWSDDVYEVWGLIHWITSHRRSRDLLDTFKTRRDAITFVESEIAAGKQKEGR